MSYDLMLSKGVELHNMGALNEALDIYQQILQAMPENSDVWNLSGLISQSKDEHIKAIDCFLCAIKYSPKPFAPYYFNLAISYKALNKKSEAREAFEKVISIDNKFKEGWNYLGLILEDIGEHNKAIKSFCKALEIDNDYEEARVNLCYYTNDFELLEKMALESDNFEVNLKAGLIINDLEKKEKFLKKALKINPDREDGLGAMANYLKTIGCIDEALMYYHKILNINNESLEAILGVADIYLNKKDYDNAEKFYKKSFDISRNIYGAYLNYGTLLYEQKRFVEALEVYRKAIEINPNSHEASYNLALILKDIGDKEEALGLMFNAHLRDSSNNLYSISIMELLVELSAINPELALKIALNWQKHSPDNIFSKRILDGLCKNIDKDNDELYAKELFNVFADNYDEKMAKLDIKIIDKIKELKPDIKGCVLDLGCGTGNVALNLRNENVDFIGVDISSNMIDKAQKKNVYKHLYCTGIKDFIENKKNLKNVDLVIACDVFCYMGDLDIIFRCLKGKEIIFSVEKADNDIKGDYYLQSNGRYKHSKSYILSLAKKYKFDECQIFDLNIRDEANDKVPGMVVCFK